jgi:hypothetical protein
MTFVKKQKNRHRGTKAQRNAFRKLYTNLC